MCGIFVAIHKDGSPVETMLPHYGVALSELSFRGPDLQIETIIGSNIFFGQTVLSLTGNLEKSRKNFNSSYSNRYQIAFNGEIYNYKALKDTYLSDLPLDSIFVTDTEILVNLHEVMSASCISTILDGMYAYVLLDTKKRRLTINRDPQGEKTLYIFENDRFIYISSELKPLERVTKLSVDNQLLRDYFATRHFMFEHRTIYTGVRQLRPGQREELNLAEYTWAIAERLELAGFIDTSVYETNLTRSIDDLADELDGLMTEAMREMIPVQHNWASVLSGGVDSSLASFYSLRCGSPDMLVAVNHLGKDQISCDLANFEIYLKKKVTVLDVDQVVYSRNIISAQAALSSPIFSHSFVGQSLQAQYIRGQGCAVIMGGEGADELFGGYSAYLDRSRRVLQSRFSNSPYSRIEPLLPLDFRLVEAELSQEWEKAKIAFEHVSDEEERAAHAMMYADLAYQLPNVGLRGSDVMSMMWAVEARNLFLRRAILKFGLNLPMQFKADATENDPDIAAKRLLKHLFVRHFGRELLSPKQGFSGFPSESIIHLGPPKRFISLKVLGIDPELLNFSSWTKAAQWKLINIEYFLRSRDGVSDQNFCRGD